MQPPVLEMIQCHECLTMAAGRIKGPWDIKS